MGQQIQTAFDREDELGIISWLANRCELLCASYLMTSPELVPEKLENYSGQKLLVFPPQAIALLAAHVIPTGSANEYLVDPAVAHGSTFQWCRTTELRRNLFVAGGGDGSRFYFIKNE